MCKKWDIVFLPKFPETIECFKCKRYFSILKHKCDYCHTENTVSHIIAKPRPVILWLDKHEWVQSVAFGIPLSKSSTLLNDPYNQPIQLSDFSFLHKDNTYNVPMRAIITQATRIEANVINDNRLIGTITNTVVQNNIQEKLAKWLFNDFF